MVKKAFPSRGKYLVRYPGVSTILNLIDVFLSLKKRPFKGEIAKPKAILLSNLAHLGDVVNATAVLPVLKSAFPTAKIGFVVGNWAKGLLEDHPLIDAIHVVDHWKFNRSKISFLQKLTHYFKTKKRALFEIKTMRYDVAIDLYYYFGNAIPLVKKAKIPIRIGFTSGGFGPLLTHSFNWKNINRRVIDCYIDLLKTLNIKEDHLKKLEPTLSPIKESLYHELAIRFPKLKSSYIVIHPGTGAIFKEWPLSNWKALIEKCTDAGYAIVLTGQGRKETELISELSKDFPQTINLANQLTLKEFITLLQGARLLIGVDSAAGHIASAVKTKSVLIYPGINNSKEWAPDGGLSEILQHPVPCAPCFRRKGCKTMECVRGIEAKDVFSRISEGKPCK